MTTEQTAILLFLEQAVLSALKSGLTEDEIRERFESVLIGVHQVGMDRVQATLSRQQQENIEAFKAAKQ